MMTDGARKVNQRFSLLTDGRAGVTLWPEVMTMNEEPAKLTEEEYAALANSTSLEQWTAACDAVKRARGRQYPSDWYVRILAPGIPAKVAARFGGSAEIQLRVRA
jgi:hypothetical protein